MAEDTNNTNDKTVDVYESNDLGCFILSAFYLAALGILIFQAVSWLKNGIWTPIPLSKISYPFLSENTLHWLTMPESWIGLSKIIYYILKCPLSVSSIICGHVIDWVVKELGLPYNM